MAQDLETENETFAQWVKQLLAEKAIWLLAVGVWAGVVALYTLDNRCTRLEQWQADHEEFKSRYLSEHLHDDEVRLRALYQGVGRNTDDIKELRRRLNDNIHFHK